MDDRARGARLSYGRDIVFGIFGWLVRPGTGHSKEKKNGAWAVTVVLEGVGCVTVVFTIFNFGN